MMILLYSSDLLESRRKEVSPVVGGNNCSTVVKRTFLISAHFFISAHVLPVLLLSVKRIRVSNVNEHVVVL